ncbi:MULTISPECIES: 4-dedimethylamino-4-oxo-anhydrotetracycline transaminase OxyQ [Streptomyces]|uniref:4-dedimethylamino-4-oxo-anhydrotetracycline transaminase OxyQ n=3 Tax=Streptomyces rimosus TaxID=1927 RepID=OXYQ_STRRM|nr:MULTISPECIES: 4-dedimethylamino-4-oxo-anhydrotetracycline transaminase OxyQ [Streptomyces]Q3S8P9.1 RecName: Full=4-dedimethylamino-4-oxo-anhydrotetracycline transaminase OxyQ; AltName: Full=PLP-dependent aminotransferase OxyQ; AltName: Full=Reductive transaminase oxyQ [Streptomyces rimosus]KOG75049.1 N-succinyldiaminopimelate aminotransferase [Kitasatospora aureofaciens]MYT45477.1 4-dedimethylamino-4-oxo-anhydrotetracycline transaminase OxyQ [Streptomyces sp. SID5471]AAZ78340.1 OxyQ [Strepto
MRELPEFPWDVLLPYKKRAAAHPDGLVNLALGEPVDATPDVLRDALAAATDAPGYPPTEGTPALREAAAAWLRRRLGVTVDPSAVLPAVGTKELIAWLPAMLGTGPGDTVAFPRLAFPTFDVSARLAGARGRPVDSPLELGSEPVKVVWLNSPSNPEGRVLSVPELREIVAWARDRGAVLVNDECYIEYGWDRRPVSLLDSAVCGGSHDGLLAVHSLSKRSNLAGYRAGVCSGDPALIGRLLQVRKHAGHAVPAPVQAAMVAALEDDAHVERQRDRYAYRRRVLRTALEGAGFRVEHSEGGLFLWATRGEPCWPAVQKLADLGILVAPGAFYGEAGEQYVRIAFTATDERIAAAAARLT